MAHGRGGKILRIISAARQMLCLLSRRYRLRCICRALRLRPYPWQRAFALGRIQRIPVRTRASGKTTAVMLRLLMLPPDELLNVPAILSLDPDWLPWQRDRVKWYACHYRRLYMRCTLARIPVPQIDLTRYVPVSRG